MRLPKMWGKSQDENDLDWQGQAKFVPHAKFLFHPLNRRIFVLSPQA
jgi:hypothetical protein